jgi:hypothetical protein
MTKPKILEGSLCKQKKKNIGVNVFPQSGFCVSIGANTEVRIILKRDITKKHQGKSEDFVEITCM